MRRNEARTDSAIEEIDDLPNTKKGLETTMEKPRLIYSRVRQRLARARLMTNKSQPDYKQGGRLTIRGKSRGKL